MVVRIMKCVVCKTTAARCRIGNDWIEHNCNECGAYRLTLALYGQMAARNQTFHVLKTKVWICWERELHPEAVPLMGVEHSELLHSEA